MKTILLVDDDLFVTTLYKTKLSGEGYQVETANSGAEALSKLEHLRPDTIILDLNMPEMNGVEVLKQIRNIPELKDVPVIIFSNGHVQSLLDEVCPLGVQKFFTKSLCPPNRLLAEIQNTLEAAPIGQSGSKPTPLETAAASTAPDAPVRAVAIGAHPEVQRKVLAGLYRSVQPEMKAALADKSESRREVLGRALKHLFNDLYDHPEHITETSIQTLMQGLGNLHQADPAPTNPVLDSEAALKSILQSFEE
ncbi:MAG: response regulator [Verrucomicrobia bacterium]|nr:response regulator [Verrucomicrobiota bacterium]